MCVRPGPTDADLGGERRRNRGGCRSTAAGADFGHFILRRASTCAPRPTPRISASALRAMAQRPREPTPTFCSSTSSGRRSSRRPDGLPASTGSIRRSIDFFAAAIAADRWNGSLYALPWFVDVGMLYWRTDLVPRPPRDLADLVAAGETRPRRARRAVRVRLAGRPLRRAGHRLSRAPRRLRRRDSRRRGTGGG